MNKRAIVGTLASLALVASGILGSASAAQAAPPGYTVSYYVVDSSYVSNHVNTGDILSRCYATGGHCTITAGKSATITISLSLGASRGDVSGGLGISGASTTTITQACTSPVLASGQAWTAYPIGREYTYKIEELVHAGINVTTTYSGWLHAFSPYSNQIYCK